MTRSNHRTHFGALAVAIALALSACGASGGTDDADKATTTEAKETTTTVDAKAEAQARADSVDLSVSDFDDGWTAEPNGDTDEPSPLEDCDPTFANDEGELAKHSTDDFVFGDLDQADGAQVGSETIVFEDAETATAAVEIFNDNDVVDCIAEGLRSALEESTGATVEGSLANDDLELDTDTTGGLSGLYTLTGTDGSTVEALVGVFAFSTGDVGTLVNLIALGDSFDPSSLQKPVLALAERQAEA